MASNASAYSWADRFVTPGYVHLGHVAAVLGITPSSAWRRMRTARVPARLRTYGWSWAGRWFTRRLWVLPMSSLQALVIRDCERTIGHRLVSQLKRRGDWPPRVYTTRTR